MLPLPLKKSFEEELEQLRAFRMLPSDELLTLKVGFVGGRAASSENLDDLADEKRLWVSTTTSPGGGVLGF